eukprot:Rmarinus@m.8079
MGGLVSRPSTHYAQPQSEPETECSSFDSELTIVEELVVPVRSFTYVILGGGVASGYAANEFIKRGVPPGKLCIISMESRPPYERPALTKGYLVSGIRLPTFHTCAGKGEEAHCEEWYADNGISLLLGTTVVSCDVSGKALMTSKGERITYKHLIIATGAKPKRLHVPNAGLKGVHYFNSLRDAKAVDNLVKPNESVVLIGGGFLSMELGAALTERGMNVHIVYRSPAPMSSRLAEDIGRHYAAYYSKRGVTMHDQSSVSGFDADSHGFVSAVRITSSEGVEEVVPCCLVVIGIGCEPATGIFDQQLDMTSTGFITVGSHFQTSQPDVYAIGACCSFPSVRSGNMRQDLNVTHARESASVCVRYLFDPTTPPYDYVSVRFSRIFFSLRWKLIGDSVGTPFVIGSLNPRLIAFWVDQDRIVGGFLEGGSDKEYELLMNLVRAQPKITADMLRGRTLESIYARICPKHAVLLDVAPERYRYVILGGGVAAGYAAKEIVYRKVQSRELCIVTREDFAPYERPALSKGYLMNGTRLPSFHTCVGVGGRPQTRKWYSDHGVVLKTSTEIVHVDFSAKTLLTGTGHRIKWQTLIIATGVIPKQLPNSHIRGVHYLRELRDAQGIMDQSERAVHCVVVGSGYVGMEVAAALRERGLQVTMVLKGKHVMPMLFPPEVASHYMKFYQDRGVRFVYDAVKSDFVSSDGKLIAVDVQTSDRRLTLTCDMCVVGIGAEPELSLFKDRLHCTPFGIKVDDHMRTSENRVYAVGDIAAFPLAIEGHSPVRMEHVAHARDSAIHCVKSIFNEHGGNGVYNYLPYFYSRLFSSLSWKCYGIARGTPIVCGDFNPKLWVYFLRDDRLVGVFLESGSEEEHRVMERLARDRPHVTRSEAEGTTLLELARYLYGEDTGPDRPKEGYVRRYTPLQSPDQSPAHTPPRSPRISQVSSTTTGSSHTTTSHHTNQTYHTITSSYHTLSNHTTPTIDEPRDQMSCSASPTYAYCDGMNTSFDSTTPVMPSDHSSSLSPGQSLPQFSAHQLPLGKSPSRCTYSHSHSSHSKRSPRRQVPALKIR